MSNAGGRLKWLKVCGEWLIKGIGFLVRGDENILKLIVVMVAPHLLPQLALMVKNLPANAGDRRDLGSIPGSGRSLGGGNGNPLQYLCLGNPRNRGAWKWKWKSFSPVWLFLTPWTNTVHGILQARILKWVAFPFQGIFPTQGEKPGLPHCRCILYQLSHKRSPKIMEWVAKSQTDCGNLACTVAQSCGYAKHKWNVNFK